MRQLTFTWRVRWQRFWYFIRPIAFKRLSLGNGPFRSAHPLPSGHPERLSHFFDLPRVFVNQ